MRGALQPLRSKNLCGGIIPADAGSTFMPVRSRSCSWDHPRGCGEHSQSPIGLTFFLGSSPRMRGAPSPNLLQEFVGGIIPADAGSTLRLGKATGVYQDHPRGCGEHRPSMRYRPPFEGSSPRMRGARA